MSVSDKAVTDEAVIRQLVEDWAGAVRTKDLKGILANHSMDMLL